MSVQFTRFDPMPAGMKIPPPAVYPSKPVQPMACWRVTMVVEDSGEKRVVAEWVVKTEVWAYSSTDAVARARAEFYGGWATPSIRERLSLRVLEVLQAAV